MKRRFGQLGRDEGAAVAPLVGVALFALVAAGGIAFDYARLAALDSELQNAADQAALAAASQLDRKTGACARASAAAVSLVANQTRFANDGRGSALTLTGEASCDATGNIRFWQNATKTTAATSDATARFVEITIGSVTVNGQTAAAGRRAHYTLTPIVGAIYSDPLTATALAGLGSAICKVPPLMMCNPTPGTPFNPDAWRGIGLKLFQGGGNSWAPGAFGYLDVGAVNNGSPDQRIALGMDNPNTNCVADAGVNVDTGVSGSVLDALNVRFDIFQNGWGKNTCYGNTACSPAANTTKDLVRMHLPSASACGVADAEWRLPPDADQYIPTNDAGDDPLVTAMGYPMDICHYAGRTACPNGRFGNGSWRRDIYFRTNHSTLTAGGTNWQTATGLPSNATRYDVYRWEQRIPGVGNNVGVRPQTSATYDFNGNNNDGVYTQHGSPRCKPPGLAPGGTQPDRRVVVTAVADNCLQLNGGSTAVQVGAWAEVFLTQPSINRNAAGTSANEIYVEIIGRANPTGSGATAQVVTRDVPYLIE